MNTAVPVTLFVAVTMLFPVGVLAQVSDPPTSAMSSGQAGRLSPLGDAIQSPPASLPHNRHRGSLKGALIGLGGGVGVGIYFSRYCESNDCISRNLGAIVVLGGMGAGIGALFSQPSHREPISVPSATRIVVSPFVVPGASGGVVTVRF